MEMAAQAWRSSLLTMARDLPGAWLREGPHGTVIAFTGAPVDQMNGVFNTTADPDLDELAAFAAEAGGESERTGIPWTIELRAEPAPSVIRLAAGHGLTERIRQPFMILPLDGAARSAEPPEPSAGAPHIRRIAGGEHETFARALALGFEAPFELMSAIAAPALLEAEGATPYLAELDGVPVCTGLGMYADDCVAVFNISTPPEYRRRGYAREMVETILRDGRAAGARLAFLQSSDDGTHLYETLGFRTAEHWTSFTRPQPAA